MKRIFRVTLMALLAGTLIVGLTGCSQNAAPKEEPKATQTEKPAETPKPNSTTNPSSDSAKPKTPVTPATPTDKKPAVEEENCNC